MSEQFQGRIRVAAESDAGLISAEIRACYGDTYTSPEVLDPVWVREEIRGGRAVYVIATTPAGATAGVAALVETAPGLWDCCRAVVSPGGRSRGACTALVDHLLERVAPSVRARFVYADLVTSHDYAQRHSLSRGFVSTGLLLGMAPASLTPTGLPAPTQDVSVVLGVKRISPRPRPRVLNLQGRYLERALGVLRRLQVPARPSRLDSAALRFTATVEHLPAYGIAHLRLGTGCGLAPSEGLAYARQLGPRITWVDVPVEHPGAWAEVDWLRAQGFGWGAYVPLGGPGRQDVLRLQRIAPRVRLDPAPVQVVPELVRLKAEVFAEVLTPEEVLV